MATFNNMLVTNNGKIIYAKAMGGKTVTFNKVALGSGNPASQSEVEALTSLVKQEIVGSIESIDTTSIEGVAVITLQVSNASLASPIGIKEVGVFCLDPDTNKEVMYAYCYSPTDIDVIPSNENGEVVWKMRVQLAISNATGSPTQQPDLFEFVPVITQEPADRITTFLSNIVASGNYVITNGVLTAFYNITGNLTNMENAESGLSSLTISLPRVAVESCSVSSPMTITLSNNSAVIADILGEINEGGQVININYFGSQNGNFDLKMTIKYAV